MRETTIKTGELQVNIAGISIKMFLDSDQSARILEPDHVYRQFIQQRPSELSDIRVTLSTESSTHALLSEINRIFTAESPWSVHRSGDEYLISYTPFAGKPPLWVIRATEEFSKLTAYYSHSSLDNDAEHHRLVSPIAYPLDQVILLHHLAYKNGLIVHCAGVYSNERCVIFPGRSGAGKSSISKIISSNNKAKLLSDDRMVVRQEEDEYLAYGTPWPGEAGIAVNERARLGGMYFLTQSRINKISRLSPGDALKQLFPVASIPWYDKEVLPAVLDFCGELVSSVPAYELQFALGDELVDFLSEADVI